MSVAAALLVAVGAVFAVEMLQRIFSQDYRALSNLQAGNPWPPIRFLARDWAPNAMATWGVPLGLIVVGGLLGRFARTGSGPSRSGTCPQTARRHIRQGD